MQRTLGMVALLAGIAAVSSVHLSSTVQAAPIAFSATLSGPAEDPPNMSPGTGTALVTLDTVAHQLTVSTSFSGLLGTTTMAHIHCCTTVPGSGIAGVATQTPSFVGFPTGVSSGTYSNSFDTSLASTWNAAFIAANGGTPLGAEAALATGVLAGSAYFNVHTNLFPGGEIRGFLARVPEPGTAALLLAGLMGASLARRARIRAG